MFIKYNVKKFSLIPIYVTDLFHQSIAQSGSAFGFWARQYTPRENAETCAALAGCVNGDTDELVECLRLKTTEQLNQAYTKCVKKLTVRRIYR